MLPWPSSRKCWASAATLAYDLINDGHLAGMKIGNSFKIPKVSVIRYVMEQEAQDHAG